MSTQTSERPGAVDDEPETGRSLIDTAAEVDLSTKERLEPADAAELLDYFLGHGELPGNDDLLYLDAEVDGRAYRFAFAKLEWSEWRDNQDQATDRETGMLDPLALAAWNVARAMRRPQLGPRVTALQERASREADKKLPGPRGSRVDAPRHAADLLMQMFARNSGVLLELSADVLAHSSLQPGGPGAVRRAEQREVAAAGN